MYFIKVTTRFAGHSIKNWLQKENKWLQSIYHDVHHSTIYNDHHHKIKETVKSPKVRNRHITGSGIRLSLKTVLPKII